MTRHHTRSAPAASASCATPPPSSSASSRSAPESGDPPDIAAFDPVALRARHDGWTAGRQTAFVAALAACGNVTEAAARVGMSARSAYKLRARPDARSFREAWDVALDSAVQCLSDATFSRALHGVERPVFFQGERIGEWRQYDERLAMFILARRAPDRFGAWIDRREVRRERDQTGTALGEALKRVAEDAEACEALEAEDGRAPDGADAPSAAPPAAPAPLPERDPLPGPVFYTEAQANARAIEREAMPTSEEVDELILEKIAGLKRAQAMERERAAERWGDADVAGREGGREGGRKGGRKGGTYAALRELPDEAEDEEWDEDDWDEEDRDGDEREHRAEAEPPEGVKRSEPRIAPGARW
ncbi:hypothetical protein [Novosphingopyxis sp.]|uniref:hypothetical protein n=1 Tax=Novosphingopyxis sp. TaxID=2709690 RepID=UPI003B5B1310